MATQYYLINISDNSVNSVLDDPHPQHMFGNPAVVYEVEYDIDTNTTLTDEQKQIPVDLFWDKETQSLIPSELGFIRIAGDDLQSFIDQQQELGAQITQAEQADKYESLVVLLKQLFPDDPRVDAILSDSTVTQEELSEIETMLAQDERQD